MAGDLDIPIRIVGHETIREADGLALSSRNRFLSADERERAPLLHRTLGAAARMIRSRGHVGTALAEGREVLERAGFVLDYLEARHAASLAPIETASAEPIRLLVAARLGTTRLIDNMAA